MKKKKANHTLESKLEAAKQVIAKEITGTEAAEMYDVSPGTISNWVKLARSHKDRTKTPYKKTPKAQVTAPNRGSGMGIKINGIEFVVAKNEVTLRFAQ